MVGFVSSVITACVLGPEGRGLLSAALLISTLAYMGTIEQYGYYTVVFMTSKLIGSVQDAISTTLFARFADKNIEELGDKVRTAFRMSFLPMLALGAALLPWIIDWAYGKSFVAILLFECVIGGASWTLAQQFNAAGRPGLVLLRQFVSVVPVFAVIPFLPHENTYVYLAGLLLGAVVLRLAVTMGIYLVSLKEPLPQLLPTARDYRAIRQLIARA